MSITTNNIKAKALYEALKSLKSVAPSNPTHPVLAYVLLEVKEEKITLKGTNLTFMMEVSFYHSSEKTPEEMYSCLLPFVPLYSFAKNCQKDGMITFRHEEMTNFVLIGKTETKVIPHTMSIDEMPEFPSRNLTTTEKIAFLEKEDVNRIVNGILPFAVPSNNWSEKEDLKSLVLSNTEEEGNLRVKASDSYFCSQIDICQSGYKEGTFTKGVYTIPVRVFEILKVLPKDVSLCHIEINPAEHYDIGLYLLSKDISIDLFTRYGDSPNHLIKEEVNKQIQDRISKSKMLMSIELFEIKEALSVFGKPKSKKEQLITLERENNKLILSGTIDGVFISSQCDVEWMSHVGAFSRKMSLNWLKKVIDALSSQVISRFPSAYLKEYLDDHYFYVFSASNLKIIMQDCKARIDDDDDENEHLGEIDDFFFDHLDEEENDDKLIVS